MNETTMLERYNGAKKLLTHNIRGLVKNGKPVITWARDEKTGAERATIASDAKAAADLTTETISPDGKWRLKTIDYNLWLIGEAGEKQLTFDGKEDYEYGRYLDIYSQVTRKVAGAKEFPAALFSPDSRYFITYRTDLSRVKKLPVIESCGGSPENLRPVLHQYACPFAVDTDDEMPDTRVLLGDVEKAALYELDIPTYVMPFFMTKEKAFAKWLEDSSGFYITWYDRSCKKGRLYLVDVAEHKAHLYVDEKVDTFHSLGAFGLLDGFGTYLFSNFITSDKKTAYWQSERSGYAHLYRYDNNGNCLGDLFEDAAKELIVQKLIRLDEKSGRLYFMANNISECSDPLYYSLYSIGLDGTGLKRLTPEDATHSIFMGQEHFADTYSRVDLPPVTVVRDLEGNLIEKLVEADVSELLKAGYIIPETFTVKADDGVTDLYGILIKPADFDAKKTYPVIDYVYGGAQLYNVPREFTWDNAMNREIFGGLEEFAQLGFVGVIIDGRGTPGRGKAFHDFSYRNIHGCAGLDDHPGAIRRLKDQYPFLDLDRVGIWGNSGGGYATVSALFKYGDFYKVGVASSGNYDQRVYENSWTERYYGPYDSKLYEKGDITALAENLKGKLLLACGCMDDNVTIWQTFRLCDELARHNKDYDLMVLPRVNHNVPSDIYFMRRKLDYFVQHLMGQEPPKEFIL